MYGLALFQKTAFIYPNTYVHSAWQWTEPSSTAVIKAWMNGGSVLF